MDMRLLARRRMFLAPLASVLAAGLAGCGGPPDLDLPETPWPVPADYPQRFRTEANRIVDSRGRPAVLRGVALPDPVWLASRPDGALGAFDRHLFRTAAEWGAGVVRVSLFPAVIRRHGMAETVRVLDWAVAYARRYGLYLILALHGVGFPPDGSHLPLADAAYGPLYAASEAEMRAFWQRIALRYRSEPAVAFYELYNEPVRLGPDGRPLQGEEAADWLRLRDWAERMVDAVRAIDPLKPVMVGGVQFAYDLAWAARQPLRRANIVYVTHPYADADWRTPWEEAFLRPAAVLPVFATEFGWDAERHPEQAYRGAGRYREAIFAAFDRARMGWTAWSFSLGFRPALLAHAGLEPTEYGAVVRAALRARALPPPGAGAAARVLAG